MWYTACPLSAFVLNTVLNPRSPYPRSAAIAAPRRIIAPTSASSPGTSAFSVSMCRFGITSACSGACGLMSLMTNRSSSS